MGYVRQWDDFAEAAQQLFREHPNTVRYSVKYRHCDGKLLLKVTNNQQCLLYKTDQVQELKKVERLNNIFFTLAVKGASASVEEAEHATEELQPRSQDQLMGKQSGRKNRRRG
mmetsp:Transcript_17329/g.30937  ORF Transcript_17329/g.30937 Transcript_17329/m.30937 type:complete len:113 (-) Transcript_17329:243-581(-)|eukprot:CAMPEP_0177777722 /NCGR_PEP_ID=MMETSP0491_2-20121128/15541_1 /TAXON_ID=63592 /ORGANISM="Tetraselmis chuii, Strain PLY429" /LENGTH=112 /DNA_ID=CAMNT_0019296885 /DNA_START=53 /DNA_END=391 /DNA_ORIENTATION=-